MRWLWTLTALLGLVGVTLGLLWFLQGSDLLHIDPIACAASCEPIQGHQPAWQLAGAVAVAIGSVAAATGWRKLRS
jgi:hypothetical protein